MTIIATERLALRPLVPADAADLARLIADWQVIRWLIAPPWPYRLADAREYLASDAAAETRAITLGGDLIGAIGVHETDWGQWPELGYWLGRAWHGNGYMTEAASAMVDTFFASEGGCLGSGYLPENVASANVLAKLGFRPAGSRTALARPLGRQVDLVRVKLGVADWRASHAG